MAGMYYDKFFDYFINDLDWKKKIKIIINRYGQKAPDNIYEIKQRLSTIYQTKSLEKEYSTSVTYSKKKYYDLKKSDPYKYIGRLLWAAYSNNDLEALKEIYKDIIPPPPPVPSIKDLLTQIQILKADVMRKNDKINSLEEDYNNLNISYKSLQDEYDEVNTKYNELKKKCDKQEKQIEILKKQIEDLINRPEPPIQPINGDPRNILFCGLKPKGDFVLNHQCVENPFNEEELEKAFNGPSFTEVWYNKEQLKKWKIAVLFAKIKQHQSDIAFVGVEKSQLDKFGLEVVSK